MITCEPTREEILRYCPYLKQVHKTLNEIYGNDERDSKSLRSNNVSINIMERLMH